jgi:general stress protein 26
MALKTAVAELDPRFSSPDASPTPWERARARLEEAQTYWLTTVRSDGRPHVTPLIAVWLNDAMYFCTGPDEQKAKNLAQNRNCILSTGGNTFQGLDLAVEGEAVRVIDQPKLQRIADAYASKYDDPFKFEVRDGAFVNAEDGKALVFEVAPRKALGFGKDEAFSQTRWRF